MQNLIATTFEVVHYIALQAVHYKPLQEVHLSRYNHVDYVHSIAQGPGRDFIVNLKEPYSSIEFILTPEKKKELIEMLMYGSSSYQPE